MNPLPATDREKELMTVAGLTGIAGMSIGLIIGMILMWIIMRRIA